MQRLKPEKLSVRYFADASPEKLILPRRYTFTHSDITGKLFLSIGSEYDRQQISNLYTRFMRDEVLAELCNDGDNIVFRVYCHVSGGFVFGTAKMRYKIFQSVLILPLEAIRYGDRAIFDQEPDLDLVPILVHFSSTNSRFLKVEEWGIMSDYK